jgi:hypothetical protein
MRQCRVSGSPKIARGCERFLRATPGTHVIRNRAASAALENVASHQVPLTRHKSGRNSFPGVLAKGARTPGYRLCCRYRGEWHRVAIAKNVDIRNHAA